MALQVTEKDGQSVVFQKVGVETVVGTALGRKQAFARVCLQVVQPAVEGTESIVDLRKQIFCKSITNLLLYLPVTVRLALIGRADGASSKLDLS